MAKQVRHLLVMALFVVSCSGQALKLQGFDPINVDATANTASTHLRIKNLDTKTAATCTLSIGGFTSVNTGKDMYVVATFYDPDTAGPPLVAGRAVGSTLEVNVAPGKEFTIKVDLAHMVEAGESNGKLYCGDEAIGDLMALKQLGLLFKVSVNETPAEKPVLAFVDGEPLAVQLKNDELVTYPICWELLIKGKSVTGPAIIQPNDVTTIKITPDASWFSSYTSLFKDETADGKFTMHYQPKGKLAADAFPAKVVTINAQLSYFPHSKRDLLATIVILGVLAFGGLLSSYFNVDLVNRLRQVGIKNRLADLEKQIGEIAPQLASQLRVSLLLERKRIVAELPKGLFFTPETASVLAQCGTDTDNLEARVKLAAQVFDVVRREERAVADGLLPATLADRLERDLVAAQDLLRKSASTSAELQKVQTLIDDGVNILDNLSASDAALEQILTDRMTDLTAKLTADVQANPTYVAIKAAAPVPFTLLDAGGNSGSQEARDEKGRKLLVVYDMIEMRLPAGPAIVENLKLQGLLSLRSAELLLREAKEGVQASDLQAAIEANPPAFSIIIDRDVVRLDRASLTRIVFSNPRYNQAGAKSLLECTWHFGDGLTERGWEVYHYYARVQAYDVTVTFCDQSKAAIKLGTPAPTLHIDVQKPYPQGGSHWAIEIQRWLIGFLVAVIALFAGAKDKIVNLDTLGAIFAVFLLGFTIDVAKNLIVPKQP